MTSHYTPRLWRTARRVTAGGGTWYLSRNCARVRLRWCDVAIPQSEGRNTSEPAVSGACGRRPTRGGRRCAEARRKSTLRSPGVVAALGGIDIPGERLRRETSWRSPGISRLTRLRHGGRQHRFSRARIQRVARGVPATRRHEAWGQCSASGATLQTARRGRTVALRRRPRLHRHRLHARWQPE